MKTISYPNTTIRISEMIKEDSFSTTYRGELHGITEPKIVRIQKENIHNDGDHYFLNEIEVCKTINDGSILKLESVLQKSQSYSLVFENCPYHLLTESKVIGNFEIEEFLKFAIQITKILQKIHEKGLIYNRIEPSNIFYKNSNSKIKLIGLGYSSFPINNRSMRFNCDFTTDNLYYISPERTGRLKLDIDHRSDLYSLGILFYEMLVGHVPFQSKDPLEIIHHHIAKQPPLISSKKSNIPPIIIECIERLYSKNPDDRYQSTEHLLKDLEHIQSTLDEFGFIPNSTALYEKSNGYLKKFKINLNRNDITEKLNEGIQNTKSGKRTCLFIHGESGTGKTFAILNNHNIVQSHHAVILNGKFDIDRRNIPYYAVKQILNETLKYLLTKNESDLQEIKHSIATNIGESFSAIINLFPGLNKIYNPEKDTNLRLPHDDLFIFSTLVNFLTLCYRKQEPAILFLDDIQWADDASLQFLDYLTRNQEWEGLLILLCSRNGLNSTELTELNKICHKFDILIQHHILPYTEQQISDFISSSLEFDKNDLGKLSLLLYEKTLGYSDNLDNFINSLEKENVVIFNPSSLKWNIEWHTLIAKNINTNVANFLIDKLSNSLDPDHEFLYNTAIIGNVFPLRLLYHIYQDRLQTLKLALIEYINEGIIQQTHSEFRLFPFFQMLDTKSNKEAIDKLLSNADFQFSHDKIRFSILDRLPEAKKKEIHFNIALASIHLFDDKTIADESLYIANHLIEAKDQERMSDPQFKGIFFQYLKKAGDVSRTTGAFDAAYLYYKAIEPLSKYLGEENPHRKEHFEVLVSLSETAYYSERTEEAENLLKYLYENINNITEKAKLSLVKIEIYNTLNKYDNAYYTGIETLKFLGQPLPEKPNFIHVVKELILMTFYRRGRSVNQLINDKLNTDPSISESLIILFNLLNYGKHKNVSLFIILFLRLINLSLKYGISKKSYVGYAGFGSMLFLMTGNLTKLNSYWNLAESILKRLQTENYYGRFFFGKNMLYDYLVYPYSKISRLCEDSYRRCMQYGDFLWAAFSIFSETIYSLYAARSISEFSDSLQELERKSSTLSFTGLPMILGIGEHFIHGLENSNNRTFSLNGQVLDCKEFESKYLDEISNGSINTFYCVISGLLDYLYGDYDQAINRFKKYDMDLEKSRTLFLYYEYRLIQSLCFIEKARKNKNLPLSHKIFIKISIFLLKRLAKVNPSNFRTNYQLIVAEYNAYCYPERDNIYYDQLLDEFDIYDASLKKGLSYYLYGKFKLSKSKKILSDFAFQQAEEIFVSWGAVAKASDIRNQYLDSSLKVNILISSKKITERGNLNHTDIDLVSIVKASQSISSLINPLELQKQLLSTLVENAGASKGYLILNEESGLTVKIGHSIDQYSESLPKLLDDCRSFLPIESIYYAYRTGKKLIINSETKSSYLKTSTYIKENDPKSILLLPITKQGKVVAIVYLENKLITDIFNNSRIEILEILASQAAISFENSKLYSEIKNLNQELERKVDARTKELMQTLNILKKDLNYSKKIQTSILPTIHPIPQLSYALIYQPMDEVGGDFYDFFQINEHTSRFFIADATGHGIQAALITMAIKSEYENLKKTALTPADILTELNSIVINKYKTLFFSCVVMDIDVKNLDVKYSSAGHPAQILLQDGKAIEMKKSGALLGLKKDMDYELISMKLQPDDRIYLFTDGVYEIFNDERIEFGEDRFYELLLASYKQKPADQILTLENALIHYQGNGEFEDDLTLLAIQLVPEVK
ncbi:trifunctional serine/threonine-protein kinase/ATP-binding protein/SpoIIE family protein phosphatase [Leptospira sp. GIMC2001]|uniref:trifunctional serine/threonine-protein kinase/ATP-binding protein/SpoIIE family protein phosphatase n=1 Tax=Leptospira sp. GIMC2001 TaxID=1513297 RepID=UPI00234B1B3D|nr:trifunctional serine/threonine-protein kinase/ATP-binding protein/SpoIIE family protein phosphatase [Leptospira sp. GIMC2001]WCL50122.1 SpoIIE family protein phosphatase [Leptospira sp. GIMC2001]